MSDLPAIVDKIIRHHQKHSQWCLEVCPMIICADEMKELNIYVDKMFGPFTRPVEDVEAFYGVKLVVKDE